MQEGTPSRTALAVAMRRAAHQIYDVPRIFEDPVALPILMANYAAEFATRLARPETIFSVVLRAFVVARSRYAEDMLASAVAHGVRQYVLLGAGLDTFAYRNPHPGLRVFEVDHPATQGWKRQLLHAAEIAQPGNASFVPVDFEKQSLAGELASAGFERDAPAFFAWLGVVPYLTEEAFAATLEFVAQQKSGSGVVYDYTLPPSALPEAERPFFDRFAEAVARAGEPFRLFLTPEGMRERLRAFRKVEDLGSDEITARYFAGRPDGLRVLGTSGRLLSAWL